MALKVSKNEFSPCMHDFQSMFSHCSKLCIEGLKPDEKSHPNKNSQLVAPKSVTYTILGIFTAVFLSLIKQPKIEAYKLRILSSISDSMDPWHDIISKHQSPSLSGLKKYRKSLPLRMQQIHVLSDRHPFDEKSPCSSFFLRKSSTLTMFENVHVFTCPNIKEKVRLQNKQLNSQQSCC